MHQKVVSLIPGWGVFRGQVTGVSLAHPCLSLSLSLSPHSVPLSKTSVNISSSENKKTKAPKLLNAPALLRQLNLKERRDRSACFLGAGRGVGGMRFRLGLPDPGPSSPPPHHHVVTGPGAPPLSQLAVSSLETHIRPVSPGRRQVPGKRWLAGWLVSCLREGLSEHDKIKCHTGRRTPHHAFRLPRPPHRRAPAHP